MKKLKALEILKELESYPLGFCHFKKEILKEAIAELEALQNRSCENCRHLEKKEKNLKFECLLEVCRTCTRNNNDNWEVKNERN